MVIAGIMGIEIADAGIHQGVIGQPRHLALNALRQKLVDAVHEILQHSAQDQDHGQDHGNQLNPAVEILLIQRGEQSPRDGNRGQLGHSRRSLQQGRQHGKSQPFGQGGQDRQNHIQDELRALTGGKPEAGGQEIQKLSETFHAEACPA